MLDIQQPTYYVLLLTINVTLALVAMLAACLCCKKKEPKNELLGLEGLVKLKNPDELLVVHAVGNSESQADLNLSSVSNADSEKRASTAAHRSLPDIPVAENNGDNGSELYETVADKRLLHSNQHQHKSPSPSLKQQASVSQHSSISQADDVSSPYSRVKNSPHDYAKVRSTEHPYAQLNAPSSSIASASASSQQALDATSHSNNTLHAAQRASNANLNADTQQAEIPAASAIAGIIAASQDLPYMTPPINNQQHFSGDSQDSSKGYTSISVREPLANIMAQQSTTSSTAQSVSAAAAAAAAAAKMTTREVNDSHYATVSDDSDETYAAIDDPNARQSVAAAAAANAAACSSSSAADIYTSGSETYAQIQPMHSNSIVVAVEINNTSGLSSSSSLAFEQAGSSANNTSSTATNAIGAKCNNAAELTSTMPPVDSLRAQMHSRQASSSSNNSSMGNLGSPKPEKRQANSPLPPTPKANAQQQQQLLAASSSSNLTSGRNSVISVIECGGVLDTSGSGSSTSANAAAVEESPRKQNKSLSPSKDIEGMYAKVMKKNKFARNASSSQNNSPIMTRKYNEADGATAATTTTALGVSPLDCAAEELTDSAQHANSVSGSATDKRSRTRSNSYSVKEHGYETIPADALRVATTGGVVIENRKSDCYANILQKERQLEAASKLSNAQLTYNTVNNKPPNRTDKDYETIADPKTAVATTLPPLPAPPPHNKSNNDPGYETLMKHTTTTATLTICNNDVDGDDDDDKAKKSSDYDPNYEVLQTPKTSATLGDDGYAKVLEKHRHTQDEDLTDGYSKLLEKHRQTHDDDLLDGYSKVRGSDMDDGSAGGYSTIGDAKLRSDANHNYASILETKAAVLSIVGDNSDDHYARIAESTLKAATAAQRPNTLTTSDSGKTSLPLPATPSPHTCSSSPLLLLANSTIAGSSSSSNITTTTTNSSSIASSHQTPSSAQYESLTGSDTDPNYESVCYLNTSRGSGGAGVDAADEHDYERLQPDYSDTQLTPEEQHQSVGNNPVNANGAKPPTTGSAVELSENVIVDDYFQV